MLAYKFAAYAGIIDLFDHLPAEIGLDELRAALVLTAVCINTFGKLILNPSEQATTQLKTDIEQAYSAQSNCLSILRKLSSLALMREIGAILTDLHRILEEFDLPK